MSGQQSHELAEIWAECWQYTRNSIYSLKILKFEIKFRENKFVIFLFVEYQLQKQVAIPQKIPFQPQRMKNMNFILVQINPMDAH